MDFRTTDPSVGRVSCDKSSCLALGIGPMVFYFVVGDAVHLLTGKLLFICHKKWAILTFDWFGAKVPASWHLVVLAVTFLAVSPCNRLFSSAWLPSIVLRLSRWTRYLTILLLSPCSRRSSCFMWALWALFMRALVILLSSTRFHVSFIIHTFLSIAL